MPHSLLNAQTHRPWPVPRGPWVMTQTWSQLLFAHWPLPPELIRPLLPPSLTLDTYEGQAWVGVVPFVMNAVRFRGLFPVPTTTTFLEMNVRTYVTSEGKPGVWFFSLDASQPLAVEVARLTFSLPYFHARMAIRTDDNGIHYSNHRNDRRGGAGAFEAQYRPVGEVYHSQPETLEHFLTERYCLYSASRRGRLYRGHIHHAPWPLQHAEADIKTNTVTESFGIKLPDVPPLLHYSANLPVVAWYLETLR